MLPGCANMIPPTGGPRDSLPPVLVSVTPPDSSKGFKGKTITFTFDEYILQPENLTENLIISPTPSVFPSVESRLRTLTVRLKDTLEPNTTYYFNFGKAIKDVNEGNILKDFSYIFTTGNTFDTLQLAGKVVLAETGEIDSTLIVMLHRSGDDSAVVKERPRYVAKLDSSGNFRFMFLKEGTYYIYALKDESGGRRYFSPTQLFAFSDSAVGVKPDATPVILYAYSDKKDQAGGTINFGGGNKANTGNRPADNKLKYTTNLSANSQDLLSKLVISFDQPLKTLDTSKIELSTDSAFSRINNGSWELDSTRKKLSLTINWTDSKLYNLVLPQDFAEDSLSRTLTKADTIRFMTKRLTDYGSLRLSFKNIDLSRNPVVQFSQANRVINSFPLTSEELYRALFFPGEYEISILYDDNKNGIWDPGKFFGTKRQPEIVKPLKRKFTIRADWQNEFDITL